MQYLHCYIAKNGLIVSGPHEQQTAQNLVRFYEEQEDTKWRYVNDGILSKEEIANWSVVPARYCNIESKPGVIETPEVIDF